MKLQSQVSREYKGTKYEKFWVVLPSKLVEKLGWKSGQELNGDVKNGKLTIMLNKRDRTIQSIFSQVFIFVSRVTSYITKSAQIIPTSKIIVLNSILFL